MKKDRFLLTERELYKEIVGKHIRAKRLELEITLEHLAEQIGVDDKNLGRIERGEKLPNSLTLGLIQIALSLNSDVFLSEFEERRKHL